MKKGIPSAVFLAGVTAGIAVVSINLLGAGPWALALAAFALLVILSPFVPALYSLSRPIAVIGAVLSLLAVLLGLLAATTGGSFRLPGEQKLFLLLLLIFSVSGWLFGRGKGSKRDEIGRV